MALLERKALEQPIDQRRPVSVEEEDAGERSLLRMPMRKRLRLRSGELAAQRFVTLLRSVDHLRVKRAQLVLHLAEHRPGRADKRGVESRHLRDDAFDASA